MEENFDYDREEMVRILSLFGGKVSQEYEGEIPEDPSPSTDIYYSTNYLTKQFSENEIIGLVENGFLEYDPKMNCIQLRNDQEIYETAREIVELEYHERRSPGDVAELLEIGNTEPEEVEESEKVKMELGSIYKRTLNILDRLEKPVKSGSVDSKIGFDYTGSIEEVLEFLEAAGLAEKHSGRRWRISQHIDLSEFEPSSPKEETLRENRMFRR